MKLGKDEYIATSYKQKWSLKNRNLNHKKDGGSLRVDLEFLGSEARCRFLWNMSSSRDRGFPTLTLDGKPKIQKAPRA